MEFWEDLTPQRSKHLLFKSIDYHAVDFQGGVPGVK